jgi:hypothetical protein
MKSGELKRILKPLIKQCVKEVVLEEGILSGIISEVVVGLNKPMLVESAKVAPPTKMQRIVNNDLSREKKKLLGAIGKEAFNGVDVFEGVSPVPAEKSKAQMGADPLSGTDPSDPGVDISGILAIGGKSWKALI